MTDRYQIRLIIRHGESQSVFNNMLVHHKLSGPDVFGYLSHRSEGTFDSCDGLAT